ncbi:MAG: AMIN domain-containing protein [Candidatus Krumholzibacteriota bacterium]|nr:AMIN domain-containing protein [Candidatus Krumholzibacteriota bacterium]
MMTAIRRIALAVLAAVMLPLFGLSAGTVNEINGLTVVPGDGTVRLEISTAGDVEFKVFRMDGPDRLVVDCIGAKHAIDGVSGPMDNALVSNVRTSQFQYDPVMISRIVVDLAARADWRMFDEKGMRVVEISTAAPVETAAGAGRSVSSPPILNTAAMGPVLPVVVPARGGHKQGASPAEEPVPAPVEESPWVVETAPAVAEDPTPSERTVMPVDENLPWNDAYTRGAPAAGGGAGMAARRITIDAQGADIKTVLRTIGDFAGINIVYGKEVKGEVHVHITDAPWEEALDILLKANGYGYREEYGMIRVAEMKSLLQEELELQTAGKKKDELLPLVTRIIFVNNANADELKQALQNVVSSRGKIDVDYGSNSLIVNDIEKNIMKIEAMVADLDRKNHQVDINAKLVEVDVEATRELGINWGLLNLHKSGVGGTGSMSVAENIASSSGTIKFGTVRSWGELNAILEMLEKSNKANIISNPRITTMDNREASILVGKEIPLIVADEAGNPITELTKIGIMLRVIPHVNADRTITLDLHPEVSELQSESTAQGGVIISTSEADTRVIVSDGDTAVIGGLIKKTETEVVRGVPVLKDIPFLGRLFSSTSQASKKQELVIFVTPNIVE